MKVAILCVLQRSNMGVITRYGPSTHGIVTGVVLDGLQTRFLVCSPLGSHLLDSELAHLLPSLNGSCRYLLASCYNSSESNTATLLAIKNRKMGSADVWQVSIQYKPNPASTRAERNLVRISDMYMSRLCFKTVYATSFLSADTLSEN